MKRLLSSLAVLLLLASWAARVGAYSSVTVPIEEPVYRRIDKLVAFGLIKTQMIGQKPYVRAEIARRLAHARTADAATVQRQRLDTGLSKATEAIKRLIGAYQEQLITLDELRSRRH
mgnify:CR=1 FL=1